MQKAFLPAGFQGGKHLAHDQLLAGKPARYRRQCHAWMHDAHIRTVHFRQIADDGHAVGRHGPLADACILRPDGIGAVECMPDGARGAQCDCRGLVFVAIVDIILRGEQGAVFRLSCFHFVDGNDAAYQATPRSIAHENGGRRIEQAGPG